MKTRLQLESLPPSVNHIYRSARSRTDGTVKVYRSQEYNTWANAMGYSVNRQMAGQKRWNEPVHVTVAMRRPRPNADLDNRLKALADLLEQLLVIDNDKLIHGWWVYWSETLPEGVAAEVVVQKFSRAIASEELLTWLDKRESGCWEFSGGRNHKGYGTFRGQGAHRAAYALWNGPIPLGLMVCHRCDNPACCNPDHLFLGTAKDNSQDMVSKGRAKTWGGPRPGSQNPTAKLTEEDVIFIRSSEVASRILAEKYGVSHSLVNRIRAGKAWKHVSAEISITAADPVTVQARRAA